MPKEIKSIRKEIYTFIESKGIKLTKEDYGFLSSEIQRHTDIRVENLTEISRKHAFTQEKVGTYLKKAKLLPKSEKLKTQIETLELVSNWLNKDAE